MCEFLRLIDSSMEHYLLTSCKEHGVKCVVKHSGEIIDHRIVDPDKYKSEKIPSADGKVADCFIFLNTGEHYLVITELKNSLGNYTEDQFVDSLALLDSMLLGDFKIKLIFLLVYGKSKSTHLKRFTARKGKNRSDLKYKGRTYSVIFKKSGFEISDTFMRDNIWEFY